MHPFKGQEIISRDEKRRVTMQEYVEASEKPAKLLVNYVGVRAPELKLIYQYLNEPMSQRQIEYDFGLPTSEGYETDRIADALDFLYTVDMINRTEEGIEPLNETILDALPFEPRLLYHLNQQSDQQGHFAAIQEILIARGIHLSLEEALRSVQREAEHSINWNINKVRMWGNLMNGIGLLTYKNREFYLSPCRALTYDVCHLAQANTSNSIAEMLQYIHENFFACLLKEADSMVVYRGLADVLRNIEDEGLVSLTYQADSQHTVDLPAPGRVEQRRTVSRFDFNTNSNNHTQNYQYPVEGKVKNRD